MSPEIPGVPIHLSPGLLVCLALAVGACREEPREDLFLDVRIEQGDPVNTTFKVQFTTSSEVDAAAVVTMDDGRDRMLPAGSPDGLRHEVVVWGLRPLSSYPLRLTADRDGETEIDDGYTLDTGANPVEIPQFEAERLVDGDALKQGYLFASMGVIPPGAMIVDVEGHIVWWALEPVIEGVNLNSSRTLPSHDGLSMLYNIFEMPMVDPPEESYHEIVRVARDGFELERLDLPGGHHDFVEHEDGSIAYLAYDTDPDTGRVADKIVTLAPDGTESTVWRVWDDFDYTPLEPCFDETQQSWSHADFLAYDEERDAYYVSLRHISTVVMVDRARGRLIWKLGRDGSYFTLDDALWFFGQHAVERTDDRILVFDNAHPEELQSRAVEYELDEESWTATQTWTYTADPPAFNVFLGDARRLDEEHRLIVWSTLGAADLVAEDGTLLWTLRGELTAGLGYTTYRESLLP